MLIHDYLTDSSRWVKLFVALDSCGNSCEVDACRLCLIGMIVKFYPSRVQEITSRVRLYLQKRGCGVSITQWNDAHERTFEDVKRLALYLKI